MQIECDASLAGDIAEITLRSKHLRAKVISRGGALTRLESPDRHGTMTNVVLAHGALETHRTNPPYFGVIVGRYANRIADGRFEVGGRTVELAHNNGANTLHGGLLGFGRRVWQITDATSHQLDLRHVSADGEDGFPGTLIADVRYTLTDEALQIDYRAVTDRETIVNLTNHSYFNLRGAGDILDHRLTIHADAFLPVREDLIPTGERRAVDGSPFDFRTPEPIGARIRNDDRQLAYGQGYDHCWVLRGAARQLRPAAELHDPYSGRLLRIATTEPGIQVYTGNLLDGAFERHAGVALETQHFPDSPHHAHFPSVRLIPGETYTSTTRFAFPDSA